MRGRAVLAAGCLLAALEAFAAFETEQQINLDAGATDQGAPDVAARPGGAVWVVFGGNAGGTYDVWLSCSSNGGVAGSFSPPLAIVASAHDEQFPRVATSVDGADFRVHVAWRNVDAAAPDGDVGYGIWRAPVETPCALQPETSTVVDDAHAQSFLEIDADFAGNAYLTWRQCPFGSTCSSSTGYRVLVGVIPPAGTTFLRTTDVTDGSASAVNPDVAVFGTSDSATFVWSVYDRPGTDASKDVIARWSTNGAQSFSSPVPIGAGTIDVTDPSIAATGAQTALLVYVQGTQLEAARARRTTTGISLTNVGRVGATPNAFTPHVSALHRTGIGLVAWQSGFDIHAAVTLDTAGTWSSQGPIGGTTREQTNPRTAVGSAYLVYESDQDQANNQETFFTRDAGVTSVIAHSLTARETTHGVDVSWRIDLPSLVGSLSLERNGATIPIESSPLPATRLVDADGRAGDRYLLRVLALNGSETVLGPAVATEGEAPGCAHGTTRTPAALLVFLAALSIACVASRYAAKR